MIIAPAPGAYTDSTRFPSTPYWQLAVNISFRAGTGEPITPPLFGPLRNAAGQAIVLNGPADPIRALFPAPDATIGIVIAASANDLRRVAYDPASTPGTGTRWQVSTITPADLSVLPDAVPDPAEGRVAIPPVWHFDDQDGLVVALRANDAGSPPYSWDRSTAALQPLTGAPKGAVGLGIIDRILILAGAESLTDPDPLRFMTVRWSRQGDYEDWTPGVDSASGELQLEGGGRIIGAGRTRFGFNVWTDRRLFLLTTTGDLDTVFAVRPVDGSEGLMSNRSWTETGGRVYYFGPDRELYAYDGGPPVQIPNPLRASTIDRLSDQQVARAYCAANPDNSEVLLWFPAGEDNTDPNTALVYNHALTAWSQWDYDRTAYARQLGLIPSLSSTKDNAIKQALQPVLPDEYILPPASPNSPAVAALSAPRRNFSPDAEDVDPFTFALFTNPIPADLVTDETWESQRLHFDHLPLPAIGAEDQIKIHSYGYGLSQYIGPTYDDVVTVDAGTNAVDIRLGGKAIQLGVTGTDIKTAFRFGAISATGQPSGSR